MARWTQPGHRPFAAPGLFIAWLASVEVVAADSGRRLRRLTARRDGREHGAPPRRSHRVKAGDRVRAWQVLGRLGNTGGSLAPHLHVYVVNGRFAGRSDGYPYTLDAFKLAAKSNVDAFAVALEGGPGSPPRDQLTPVRRKRQLPLTFTIDGFPGGR